MADTVKSTSRTVSVQGAITDCTGSLTTILGPVNVSELSTWSVIVANAGDQAFTDAQIQIAHDVTETAASVVAWLNINGLKRSENQKTGASAYQVTELSVSDTAAGASMMIGVPTRWVRVQAKGLAGTAAAAWALFHGVRASF